MKRRARNEKQRAVTSRFSIAAYAALVQEAEDRGTTVADVLRTAWSQYQEKTEQALLLRKLESRIVFKVFEVCSATLGLSADERKAAMIECNKKIKKGGQP